MWQADQGLQAHIHRILLELGHRAYLYYHLCCVGAVEPTPPPAAVPSQTRAPPPASLSSHLLLSSSRDRAISQPLTPEVQAPASSPPHSAMLSREPSGLSRRDVLEQQALQFDSPNYQTRTTTMGTADDPRRTSSSSSLKRGPQSPTTSAPERESFEYPPPMVERAKAFWSTFDVAPNDRDIIEVRMHALMWH